MYYYYYMSILYSGFSYKIFEDSGAPYEPLSALPLDLTAPAKLALLGVVAQTMSGEDGKNLCFICSIGCLEFQSVTDPV